MTMTDTSTIIEMALIRCEIIQQSIKKYEQAKAGLECLDMSRNKIRIMAVVGESDCIIKLEDDHMSLVVDCIYKQLIREIEEARKICEEIIGPKATDIPEEPQKEKKKPGRPKKEEVAPVQQKVEHEAEHEIADQNKEATYSTEEAVEKANSLIESEPESEAEAAAIQESEAEAAVVPEYVKSFCEKKQYAEFLERQVPPDREIVARAYFKKGRTPAEIADELHTTRDVIVDILKTEREKILKSKADIPSMNRKDGLDSVTELATFEVCTWCGDVFAMPNKKEWGYKYTAKGEQHYFCSWGCLCKTKKANPAKITSGGIEKWPKPIGRWQNPIPEKKKTEDVHCGKEAKYEI